MAQGLLKNQAVTGVVCARSEDKAASSEIVQRLVENSFSPFVYFIYFHYISSKSGHMLAAVLAKLLLSANGKSLTCGAERAPKWLWASDKATKIEKRPMDQWTNAFSFDLHL